MIIQDTTDDRFFRVLTELVPTLPDRWYVMEVRKVAGQWRDKTNARVEFVRKNQAK